MQASDRIEFQGLIRALAAVFRVDASEALLEGYWMALEDLPLAAVRRAVSSAIRDSRHMPRGVELRELGGEMATATRAALAWESLRKAIGQHGAYRSVDFDDPVINATVRNLGGWQRLCAMESDEFDKWLRKDFERVYGALVTAGVSGEQVKALVGIHEQSNFASGHAVALTTRVTTGLPPHRDGVLREQLGSANAEGNVRQLVNGVAKGRAL